MNILITGGLGFAGSVITEHLLKKGFKVSVIDKLLFDSSHLKNFRKKKNFQFKKIDILDYPKVDKYFKDNNFDVVFHLAAIVGDPASKVNLALTKKTNLNASKKLFNISKKYMVKKFIFFSTCSNYGLSKKSKLLKEEDNLKPLSPYAKTKVNFEKYLIKDNSKIQKIILRISTLYGISPRMRFDLTINEFSKKIFFKEKFDVYHADTWRPYLNLKDLALIVEKLIKKINLKKNKVILNTGFSDENYTKRNIIENISKLLPKNKSFKYVNADHFDRRDYKVNFSRIKILKIKKTINIKKGIKEIINYLKLSKKLNLNKKIYYNHK